MHTTSTSKTKGKGWYGKSKHFPHSIPEGGVSFPLFNGALKPNHTPGGAFLSWGVFHSDKYHLGIPERIQSMLSSLWQPEHLCTEEPHHFLMQKAIGTKQLQQRRILKPALYLRTLFPKGNFHSHSVISVANFLQTSSGTTALLVLTCFPLYPGYRFF